MPVRAVPRLIGYVGIGVALFAALRKHAVAAIRAVLGLDATGTVLLLGIIAIDLSAIDSSRRCAFLGPRRRREISSSTSKSSRAIITTDASTVASRRLSSDHSPHHIPYTKAVPLERHPRLRLVEGDHNIDCKIGGIGAMGLKSEFVKKA